MPSRVSLLILLVFGLSDCATGTVIKVNHIEGELRGMVYDWDRQPLLDATVSVKGHDSLSSITDLHGRFGTGPVTFGPVTLTITKPGYEPLTWDFRFIEGSQVLYLQLPSTDQLFERASDSLEKKEWSDFQDSLARAKAMAPNDLQGYILEASFFEMQGKVPEAIAVLEAYHSERASLAIELFLGDLYSRQGKKDQAVSHWNKALEIKDDAAVRAKVAAAK